MASWMGNNVPLSPFGKGDGGMAAALHMLQVSAPQMHTLVT